METEFGASPLPPALLAAVAELGFRTATPIQARAIPELVAGRDLVGQSKTGSGKTAAFALPLLAKLALETRELGALVLCPTRELSAQVARELRKFGHKQPGLVVVVLSGGEPVREQARALERGAHVAVGTPGRVIDHLKRRNLRVHRVATVVLDEADRMLDMGFQDDMEKVLKALPPSRQTVLFSATFPESIGALSAKYQKEPVQVRIEESTEPKPDIRQLVMSSEPSQKLEALRWLLDSHAPESALVFANLKLTVAQIEKSLAAAGVSAASLHGDLEQYDRDRVLAKFRNQSTRVLVATDVAARGIDLEALDLVVNFDLPTQPEIYVHRIGRTGRAGRQGLAVSLCAPAERQRLAAIEEYTGAALEPVARGERGERGERGKKRGDAPAVTHESKMDTLRVSGGRKDKLRAGDILGALTGEAGGLEAANVGKIEIHDHFTYVAVKKSESAAAQRSLSAGRIKGRRFQVVLVK